MDNKAKVEKYIKGIIEITGWPIDVINKKIDELIEEHSITTADGKKMSWLTRGGAAELIFHRVGGVEKREEKVINIEKVIEGYTGEIYARVLKISEAREVITKIDQTTHRVMDIVLGDSSGSLPMTVWDEKADLLEGVKVGDVLRLSGTRYYKNHLVCSSFEKVDEKNAPGLPRADELPLYSRKFLLSMAKQVGLKSESRATIVSIYQTNYTYNSCPNCHATVVSGRCRKCESEVLEPVKRLRVPVILDDSSLRVRAVLWDQTVKKLVGKGDELADICAADPTRAFEMFNTLLLGKDIIIRGAMVSGDFGLEVRVSDAELVTDLKKELEYIEKTK